MTMRHRQQGFSLVELLVVTGLISVVLGISVPYIMGYVKTARIRAAASEVAAAVQTARGRAIGRNGLYGVLFVTRSTTSYQWIIEDDMVPPITYASRADLDDLVAVEGQASRVFTLPEGVEFVTTGGTDFGFRYDGLGRWCNPTSGSSSCPVPVAGSLTTVNAIVNSASGGTIQLNQAITGLTRTLSISTGGRVQISQ